MAWEENSRICINMQLIAILSRIGVFLSCIAYCGGRPQTGNLEGYRYRLGRFADYFATGRCFICHKKGKKR